MSVRYWMVGGLGGGKEAQAESRCGEQDGHIGWARKEIAYKASLN